MIPENLDIIGKNLLRSRITLLELPKKEGPDKQSHKIIQSGFRSQAGRNISRSTIAKNRTDTAFIGTGIILIIVLGEMIDETVKKALSIKTGIPQDPIDIALDILIELLNVFSLMSLNNTSYLSVMILDGFFVIIGIIIHLRLGIFLGKDIETCDIVTMRSEMIRTGNTFGTIRILPDLIDR